MRTVPGVGEYMSPVEEAPANKFLLKLLGFQSISVRLRKVLALGSKSSGLGIPDSTEALDESHQKSKACNKQLVECLLTGEALLTIKHRACVRRGRSNGRETKKER